MKLVAGSDFEFRLSGPEIAVLACLAASLLVAGFLLFLTHSGSEDYWVSLIGLTVLLVVPVFRACVTHRMDPLEPSFIVSAAYFLYLVYAPASNLLVGNEYFFDKLVTPLVPRGSWYAALGVAGMWLGYYGRRAGRTIAFRAPSPPEGDRRAIQHALVIAIAALVLFGAYVEMSRLSWLGLLSLGQLQQTAAISDSAGGGENAFRNYLYGTVDWFTIAFIMLYAFARGRRKWLLLIFVCILLIYTTIGFRYRVLIFVAAPLIHWCLRERRRPGVMGMASTALICAIAIGVIGSMRTAFRSGSRVDVPEFSMAAAGESFARSLNIYQPYLAIIDGIPERHSFLFGSSFAYLAVHPIPRRIWPSKPEAPIATITKVTLGDAAADAGVAYPNIGEFYANFGVLGIFVGMWLFGVAMRALYEYLRRYSQNDWVRIIYAVSLPFLVQVVSRGYFVQIAQEASFLFLPLLASMWLVRRRQRTRRRGRVAGASDLFAVNGIHS